MGLAMAQEIIPNRWWNGRILRCESVGVAFSVKVFFSFFFRLRHRKHSPTSYDESDETIMKWRLSQRFAVGSPMR